jgi:HAD superfamily hydrolase (TIGR01490 family)
MKPHTYAFFDLDGTLITPTSLIAFWLHHLRTQFPSTAEKLVTEINAALAERSSRGMPRDELNPWFYRSFFRDLSVEAVRKTALDWYSSQRHLAGFFNLDVVARARAHARSKHAIVLVSGSCREIVALVAAELKAETFLCAPLEERAGRYTGELTAAPMIGAGKRAAVLELLAQRGISPARCYAYGDDPSDLPMLETVGLPRVVGRTSRSLVATARRRGWPVL